MVLPSEKNLKKWREQFSWLNITNKTLICEICCWQEDKLSSMPNFSVSLISGSSNYQLSALKDHDNSACHQYVICGKEHEEAVAVGKSLPPRNSALSTYFRITNIFRHSADEWNFIKTPWYFLSYCITKTTIFSLSKTKLH